MRLPAFFSSLTQTSLIWATLALFVLLVLATLGFIFDRKAWREPPHYLLPCRGSLYFSVLCLAGACLIGAVFIKIKYFP
jgi:hypothetical protein